MASYPEKKDVVIFYSGKEELTCLKNLSFKEMVQLRLKWHTPVNGSNVQGK